MPSACSDSNFYPLLHVLIQFPIARAGPLLFPFRFFAGRIRLANQTTLTQYRVFGFLPFLSGPIGCPVPVQLQSLELWRHALVASVRGDAPDLSARQMSLMLSVYLGDGPHTVRGLAQALRISKPAVSRALDRLGELGYVSRQRDDLDRRNVLVQRTGAGAAFLTDFAHLIDEAKTYIATLPAREVEFNVAPDAIIGVPASSAYDEAPQAAAFAAAAAE